MRTRSLIAAVIAGAITTTLVPTTAMAAPSARLSVTQSTGTTVNVAWTYKGATPASQRLQVVPVIPTAVATGEANTGSDVVAETISVPLKKSDRSKKVTGLQPGVQYTVTLTSKKPSLTAKKSIQLVTKPTAPVGVTVSWDEKVLLATWTYDGPAVKQWELTATGAGGKEPVTVKTDGSANLARLKGLDKGVSYTLTVRGVNAAGKGSNAVAIVQQAAPNAPGAVEVRPVTLDGTKVVVTWTYDGPAVTGFRVAVKAPGYARDLDVLTAGPTARSIEVDGLTPSGTYSFTVTARNAEASVSTTSAAHTANKVLSAPTNIISSAGNFSVALRWVAPVADATNPITGYRIDYSDDEGKTWRSFQSQGGATSYTITGLLNGGSYKFRVAALTAKGSGLMSSAISGVAGQVPTAPTAVRVAPATAVRQLVVSWTAPVLATGTVAGFKVEYKRSADTVWIPGPEVNGTTLTATLSDLTGGVKYQARVAAVGESGIGLFSAPVESTPFDVPVAPKLSEPTVSADKVTLKWTPQPDNGSRITGYRVEQQRGNDPEAVISGTNLVTTTTYLVSQLAPGTYRFRVFAVNAAGTSLASDPVSVEIALAPAQPVLFVTEGPASVALRWEEPATNGSPITAYKIERATGSTWTTLTDTHTTLTYTASGLTNGTQYQFRISARNKAGWSVLSASKAATPFTVPVAPTNVVLEPNIEEIKVRWSALAATASSTGGKPVTGYVVYYRQAGAGWQIAPDGRVGSATMQLLISDLNAGSTYEFKVVAENDAGPGADSAVRSAIPYSAPLAPGDVSAIGADGKVTITWSIPTLPLSPVSGASYKYKVDYSVDGGTTWLPGKDNLTDRTAEITGLTNGTPYRFRIAAGYTVGGKTSYGETAQTSATPRGVPGAPEGLRVTQLNATSVQLNWSPPANNGGGLLGDYEISFSSNGTAWSTPALTSQTTSITINGLTAGIPYIFRVRTTNTYASSAYTTVEMTPLRAPAAVSGLSVRQIANGAVTLGWNASPVGERVSGYRVEYSSGEGVWEIFSGNVTNTIVTVTGLTNGVPYQFRVSAVNVAGFGSSTTVSGTPAGPIPVSNLSATAYDAKVTLTWTLPAAGGATISGIRVRYSADAGATWVTHGVLPANSVTTQVTGLTNNTTYRFEVTVATNLGDSISRVVDTTPWAQLASAVQNLAAAPSGTEVTITWDAPASAGVGQLSYKVEYKTAASNTWTVLTNSSLGSPATVSGLTASTVYDFRVSAVNAAGAGPSTTVQATTGA